MMDQLKIRHDGDLTWIGLSSVNNTIGSALLKELELAVNECAAEFESSSVLVICGSGGKFFSPGLNLHEVSQFDRGGMSRLMQTFSRLYLKLFSFPIPVLAMLNGDALAGGFLLASCCDRRYGHSGIKVGLTSLSQSVTIPFGNRKILEFLIGCEAAEEIVDGGLCYTPEQAFQLGWLDGIFAEKDLERAVRRKALECSKDSRARRLDERSQLVAEIRQEERRHLELFLDHWFGHEAQMQIREMVRILDQRSGEGEGEADDELKGVEEE